MGNANQKEDLYSAINSDNIQEATRLITENPKLINAPMTDDCLSTPIFRAAWRGNVDMIYTLINLGADVNLTMKDRLSPLQVAARRGKEEAVDYLIQKGADMNASSFEFLNALDYAIVYTNYNVCRKLMNLGCEPKDPEYYQKIKNEKIPFHYDYEMMIDYLKRGVPHSECPSFIMNPPEKTYRDPVIDPRETWGDFFKRVANFEDPPLVERAELPAELQPQNRLYGKVLKVITGRSAIIENTPENPSAPENAEESVRLTPRGKDGKKLDGIELPEVQINPRDQTIDHMIDSKDQKVPVIIVEEEVKIEERKE